MIRMTVTMMFRLASAVLLLSWWSAVQGLPGGAPTCRGGTSAPASFHRPTDDGFVEDTIANGNLVVTVNGIQLDTAAAPLELFTGGTYEVVIAMMTDDDDDSFFRGVMVRVDGGDANVDASTTLDIVEDDTDLQINTFCLDDEELVRAGSSFVSINSTRVVVVAAAANLLFFLFTRRLIGLHPCCVYPFLMFAPFCPSCLQVSGVTHTDNNDKMNVTFTMTLTEASTNMALDVNVVQTLSPSIFFYTRFFVHAVDPPAPTAVPTGMPTLAPTMQRTIYELASNAGLTIAALADAAGLAPALNDPTAELTLLMPTEESFAALPERVVQYLTGNADTLLRFILLGHVVPQEVNATEVAKLDGQSVPFLNNVSQTVSVADNGSISITANGDMFGGQAAVIEADFYQASNGIIHVIDRILGLPNLSEVISQESSALEVALNRAGLDVDSLSNITLFAPTTAGFLTLAGMFPDLANDVLTNDAWSAHMAGLLLAHAMDTVYMAEDLMDGDVITSITGDNYTVAVSGNSTTLAPGSKNNVATVEETNGLTVQGVIHTIDAVLLPAWLFSTVYDIAKMETATLATLLESAGLADTVANTPGITRKSQNTLAAPAWCRDDE